MTPLIALDVANPEQPQEISVFEFYHPKDVCVSGDYAFVTDCNLGEHMGLFTIDISDIRELSEVSFFETRTCPTDVAVHNQYVYLLVDVLGLYVLDVTNPEDPRQIGLFNTPGAAEGLWLAYDYAYIADGYAGLRVIDISDPENPEEVCWFDTPGYAWDVCVYGDLVYVADQTGMGIYDCSETINVVPQWTEIPRDTVEFDPGELIELDLAARDRNDDELTLELAAIDLPDAASFTDNGDRTASFRWQTTEADSGIYHPFFIAGDGELNDSVEVVFMNRNLHSVEHDSAFPHRYLISTYPNPFNSSTNVTCDLPERALVSLKLYDISGREVYAVAEKTLNAGSYTFHIDAETLPSGLYYCRMEAGEYRQTIKLALVR